MLTSQASPECASPSRRIRDALRPQAAPGRVPTDDPLRAPASMLELLRSFDRIYVINLASRADRRREIDAQLKQVGLGLAAHEVTLFSAVRPSDAGGFPSIGARGCFLSHLGVLREAQRAGHSSLLILEDDVDLAPAKECENILSRLRGEEWAFFYGGYRVDAIPVARGHCANVDGGTPIGTTHFVAVRGHAVIGALVAYMEAQLLRPPGDPAGGPMHVDGTYSWFRREHPQHRTLLAVPQIAWQRASSSDIAAPRALDRVAGLRQATATLRSWKNTLRRLAKDGMS